MKTLAESGVSDACQKACGRLVRFALIAIVTLVQPIDSHAQTSLEIQVGSDSDDEEESSTGTVSLNNVTLELGQQQWVTTDYKGS